MEQLRNVGSFKLKPVLSLCPSSSPLQKWFKLDYGREILGALSL